MGWSCDISLSLTFEPHIVTSAGTFVPPSIAVEPVNTTTALEGSRVVLECAGRGYPQPRESWEMSHSRTFPSGARVEATGELVVDAVILAHAGTFICRIKDQNHTLIAERYVDLIVRGEKGRIICFSHHSIIHGNGSHLERQIVLSYVYEQLCLSKCPPSPWQITHPLL